MEVRHLQNEPGPRFFRVSALNLLLRAGASVFDVATILFIQAFEFPAKVENLLRKVGLYRRRPSIWEQMQAAAAHGAPASREDARSSMVAFSAPPVSRYHVNAYGQPLIMSEWEVLLDAIAWPVIIGVAIGFALAISLVIVHNASALEQWGKVDPAQVPWMGENP